MAVFYTTFFSTCLLLKLYSCKYFARDVKAVLYALVGCLLVMVAGLRYNVGTDYLQYASNYSTYVNQDIRWNAQPALSIIAKISHYIHDDYATWFLIMALLTVLPVLIAIKRNSDTSAEVCVAIIMYILLGCWHFSFNIVKQSVAASFLLLGVDALFKKDFKKWSVYCLLGSMFHITALLMIPIYFIVTRKLTKKLFAVMVAIALVVNFSYDRLFTLISFLKQGEGIISSNSATANNSVNILRILVHCAPVFFHYFACKEKKDDDTQFNVLLNMSILNATLNIASMNSIYFNRFCVFTNIFNILLYPKLFKRTKYVWITPCIYLLYFLFWTYDIYKSSTLVSFHWIFER